jgi:hypothetical protein
VSIKFSHSVLVVNSFLVSFNVCNLYQSSLWKKRISLKFHDVFKSLRSLVEVDSYGAGRT